MATTEIIDTVRNIVATVAKLVNGVLATLLPGREEYGVLVIAVLCGYWWKHRMWSSGGYTDWAKGAVVAYIILKLLGIGNKLF